MLKVEFKYHRVREQFPEDPMLLDIQSYDWIALMHMAESDHLLVNWLVLTVVPKLRNLSHCVTHAFRDF